MKPKSVLILSRKPEVYSTRRLVEVFTQEGHTLAVENPETFEWKAYDYVFPRLGTWRFHEAIEKLLPFQERGHFINSLPSYQKTRNKWNCLQTLGYQNILSPLTQFMDRKEFPLIELPYPFVLKENLASQGEGVFLIQSPEDLERSLNTHPEVQFYLIQEYIRESHGQDLRIFVTRQGNCLPMLRKNETGDFRSNLHAGGKAYKTDISDEEKEIAFQVLETFQLDYAGIDILRSNEGPLVIDVNPCPGIEGLESLYGKIVAPLITSLV